MRREISQLKSMIEKKMRHSYVEKYIQKPLIDLDKLTILQYMYKDIEMSSEKKQQHMTTIMLVQIALDTHELVPVRNCNEFSETEKQLSVLAGDYYSGMYYLLLSEIEDIEMIQLLATSIQKINEQKMKLFYDNFHTMEEFLQTVMEIESLLFTKTAIYLNHSCALVSIIEHFLLLKRLYREKQLVKDKQFSYLFNYINKHKIFDYTTIVVLI